MESMNQKNITVKLSLMQSAYWAAGCCAQSFAMVYFLSIGFTNTQAGIFVAVANVLGVLLQPYVTQLEFRFLGENFQRSGLFTAVISCASMLCIFLLGSSAPYVCVFFFIISTIFHVSNQSLMNIVSMRYENQGYRSNYTLSRGIGSVAFALVSFLVGIAAAQFSERCIPLLASAAALLHALVYLLLPKVGYMEYCMHPEKDSRGGLPKRFYLVLAAACFVLIGNYYITQYLFQIVTAFNGNVENMGYMAAYAALLELPGMAAVPKLKKRFSSAVLLAIASGFFMLKFLFPFVLHSMTGLIIGQSMQIFSYAIFMPMLVYYVDETLPEYHRARGQVLAVQSSFAATIFTAVTGGFLLDLFGVTTLLGTGCCFGLAGFILLVLHARKPKKEKESR